MVKSSKLVGLLYKAKCTTSCPQNLFLHYIMRLFIHILLTVYNLIWASTYVTNLQQIHLLQKKVVWAISKADYKASSKPLFANLKILDLFITYSVQKFSCSYIAMVLDIRFINIQLDTLTFTDVILVEQVLRNFRSCFKVLAGP